MTTFKVVFFFLYSNLYIETLFLLYNPWVPI